VSAAPVGELVAVSDEVLVVRCGIGRERATHAARDLVRARVAALLSWGTAAALDETLDQGDLVLARQVVGRDGRHTRLDDDWLRRLLPMAESTGPCHAGGIAEADGVLRDADDKRRLHALSGALVADMESAAVAEVAHGAAIPALAIRAVADSALTRIPRSALAAVNDDGDVNAARCVAALLRAPGELAPLLRLGQEFRAARARLAEFAQRTGPGFLCPPAQDSERHQA